MDFTTLLGSYAFPVVACVAMAWYVKYCTDENRKQIDHITEKHNKEIAEVTAALNNNTHVMEKLCVLVEAHYDKR